MGHLDFAHTVSQVQVHPGHPEDTAPARAAAPGILPEGSTAPHFAGQSQSPTPIAGVSASVAAVSSPVRFLSTDSSAGVRAAGASGLPDGLAGLVASGGRTPNLPNSPTFHASTSIAAAPGGAISQVLAFPQAGPHAALPPARSRHLGTVGPDPAAAQASLARLPLTFEANRGQADGQVQFLAGGPGYTVFLTGTQAVLALAPDPATQEGSLVRLGLTGANPAAQAVGLDEQPGTVNYIHGDDPAKWQVNVPTFARVQYAGVYPGIDLVYYGSQQQLEYDFRVAPGADPQAIGLSVTGPAVPTVDAQGDLVLHTPGGDILQHKPVIYQEGPVGRQEVAGGFIVQGTQVRFAVGAYDPSRALVIDPVLSYSTYLGGSGDDSGNAIRVDAAGNVYVAGATTSANFPTLNPFQATYHGGGLDEVFISKLNPTGTALIYSTYLGGSGPDDPNALAVDAGGNVYITGSTGSSNFPVTAGALQRTFGGGSEDGFVTKLNPTGNGLVYSTYLGGSDDDAGVGIAVDGSGNAYISGDTASTDFPTTASAYQGALLGFNSAYIAKLNATGTSLLYATYLGADVNPDSTGGNTYASGLAIDGAGNAYLTGETDSLSFPVTAGAFQRILNGNTNAFVTKVNAGGTGLVYSSFLGGEADDSGSSIAVDAAGNAYVVGTTDSLTFPTANAFQASNGGGDADAFVTKVNAAGSALVYSTYLGGLKEDDGSDIAVDAAGYAYVDGVTNSNNFPTAHAVQGTRGGSFDAWVAKFSPSGTALVYSTFLGGSGDDGANAIAVDPSLNVYVTGQTTSTNFPTTPGAYQGSLRGTTNAVITKISDIHFRVTTSAGSVNAGTPFAVTVTALDATENAAPGYRGTISFSSSDGRATLPAAYTFTAADNGVHTFTNAVTLVTAGSQTVSLTDGTASGSAAVTVQPAAARTLQLTGVPATTPAGTAFSVTVTARDQYSNVAAGYRSNVSFRSTDSRATLPAAYTFTAADSGVHTFSNGVTLATPGSQTVSVGDGALSTSAMTTVQVGAATSLQLTGVPSTVAAGTAFSITVTARDQFNNVATGYRGTVTFASSDGRATLPASYTFTAADGGVHTFTNGVALVTAGNQTVSLSDGSLSASAATAVQPGAAAILQLTGVPSSVAAGAAFSVTVTARDQYNNLATGYRGTVGFSSTDSRATLPAAYTFTAADGGVHTFTNGVTLVAAGNQTVSLSDGTLRASAATTVQVGAATALQVTGVPFSVAAGTAFSVTVTARDQFNNVAAGYRGTVTFASTDARATLPASYTFTAADSGVHTFTNGVALVTAGNQTVSLTDGSLSASAATTVRPSAATTLQLSGVAATTSAGSAFSITVTARDAYNNVATGYRGMVTFSSTDGRATLPAAYTFTAADNGVHTFSNGVTLITAGNQTVSLSDGTLSASAATTVQPGAARTLQLSGVPATTPAGAAFSVTVTARDQFNNLATGYRGTISFSSTDSRATLPAAYPFTAADSGVHTFTNGVTLATAGNQTLALTDGSLSTSAMTTVQAGVATLLQLTGVPSTVAAGTAFSVTITARDQNNNVATGYRGTVTFASSDGRASLPTAYTFTAADSGMHTFNNGVVLLTAGSQTVSLTDGTLGASAATTVQPGTAVTLQLTGVPATTIAGTAFSVTVTALDQFNNVATGYQGTVSFSSSDAGATLPASYTFTAADAGMVTFTNGVTLTTAGSQTVSLTDGTLNANAATTVQPGMAVALQLTGVPFSVVAGTPFTVTVTALDAYNNVATGYQGTVSFGSSDGGATLPVSYTFTAEDAGMVTFTNGITLVTAGNQSLTVTDGTLTTGASITVTPAPAVALVLSVPANVVSGMPFDGTLTAVDPYGNTDVNYTGTVSFSSSDPDPGVMLPASYTFSATDQGSVYFPGGFTLITAGPQSITATDDSGITGSATVTVNTGGASVRSGTLSAAHEAAVDWALALTRSTPLTASLPIGGIGHPALPDTAVEHLPVAAPTLGNADMDHYFTLSFSRKNEMSGTWNDQNPLAQVLAEI